jgi:catechol 2,3-dioxygenase-like lactoylglutathione lyase family enzyme
VLVFERAKKSVGTSGGIAHFGFRVTSPDELANAASLIREAGGVVTEEGEFVPGEPYVFARDPEGFLFEIWYELPTPVDPK